MPNSQNLSNVNVGTSANAGNGDVLREAFIKVNTNFNAVYNNGQYKSYLSDSIDFPGYTWDGDNDTGMYHAGTGKIGFTINGAPHLILDEAGTIKWLNAELSTKGYVDTSIAALTGGVLTGNIGGIPVVTSLPTSGNYEGKIAYYLGDIWTYTSYPVGNGATLGADPAIARAAGSDSRWVRFRGDQALSIGLVKPSTAPEGTIYYETGNATIYLYLSGQWATLSGVITSNTPSGLDVRASLPSVGDPGNYTGRTVVVGNTSYIFISGQWKNLGNYITGASSNTGSGITSGTTLPATANVGELFRVTGTGLYIYDGGWKTIPQYTANTSTASIRTLATLPTNVTYYNAGDLIIVGNKTYILNQDKSAWTLFTPGASNTITNVVLSPGQVTTNVLANSSVTSDKIAANTITAGDIQDNTITTVKIADQAITAVKIAPNSITSAKIQAGVITDREIAGNSIPGSKLQVGSITSRELSVNSIPASTISANTLSEITQNAGNIVTGVFSSADGKMVIDLNSKFIRIEI
jgi:hypothetical protein